MRKRQLFILLIFTFVISSNYLLAQDSTRFQIGFRINLAASRLIGNIESNQFLVRPTFGLDVSKTVTRYFQLAGQVLYSVYGNIEHYSSGLPNEKYITKYGYLTIPVILRINRPHSRFAISLGIQYGILLSKSFDHVNGPLPGGSTSGLLGPRLTTTDLGSIIGLGYRFTRHFYTDFRYYQSFNRLLKDYQTVDPITGLTIPVRGQDIRNQSFSVGTTYYF